MDKVQVFMKMGGDLELIRSYLVLGFIPILSNFQSFIVFRPKVQMLIPILMFNYLRSPPFS